MDWSILLDCFITLNNDLSLSLEDNKDELITKDIEQLKNLLKDEDKVKIDHFAIGITNHLEIVELNHLKKAIYFGVKFGMEIQQMISDYYNDEETLLT